MNLLIIALGLNIQFIFLLKRSWLAKKDGLIILFITLIALFILSYWLIGNRIGNPKTLVILKVPLLALLMFVGLKLFYFKDFNKNPEDTFWEMNSNQGTDAGFNFMFWFLSLVVPVLLVAFKVV